MKTETLLNSEEIMTKLHCTRKMLSKYYTNYNLPLQEINNKFYISKTDLNTWISYMENQTISNKIIDILGDIIMLGSIIIVICLALNNLF